MQRQRLAVRPPREGFTLVELLVVVLIIGILIAILMPVIALVMRNVTATKSQQRVLNLANGTVAYYKDNGIYPGQAGWGKDRLNDQTATGLTGSQLLAKALFSDIDGTGFPKSNYATYDTTTTLFTISSKPNTIGDCWPGNQVMAICYYPARLGETGVGMFHGGPAQNADDNWAYTTGNISGTFTFATAIQAFPANGALPATPYKANQFIIIAPGPDRKYFNADDKNNFGGQ